jgi:protein SCO1/2
MGLEGGTQVPEKTPGAAPEARRPGSFAPIALGIALMILLAVAVQRLRRGDALADGPGREGERSDVDASGTVFGRKLANWGPVPDLELTDRLGRPFRFDQLRDKVLVTNFFFSSCPSVCVGLTRQVRTLVAQLRGRAEVEFVSITVDPDADTPDQLTQFARAQGGESPRWHWLTGSRELITATTFAFYAPFGDKDDAGDIVHSTKLYLVDRAGRIRSMINTQDDAKWFERCLHEVGVLLEETAATDAGAPPERTAPPVDSSSR